MSEFDPNMDYCGPQNGPAWLRTAIPDKVFGVELKRACYMHDAGWKLGKIMDSDRSFRKHIKIAFKHQKPGRWGSVQGFFVSYWYFIAVRLGSMFYD